MKNSRFNLHPTVIFPWNILLPVFSCCYLLTFWDGLSDSIACNSITRTPSDSFPTLDRGIVSYFKSIDDTRCIRNPTGTRTVTSAFVIAPSWKTPKAMISKKSSPFVEKVYSGHWNNYPLESRYPKGSDSMPIPSLSLSKIPLEEDLQRQVSRAKLLLEEAKKKLASTSSSVSSSPSSASRIPLPSEEQIHNDTNANKYKQNPKSKRDMVIKDKNEVTGLFTTDGELMASLSVEEEWEAKSLMQVFESELEEESDVSKHIANRDVVASIRNLKRELQNDDYKRIFDTKNRFIGEDY